MKIYILIPNYDRGYGRPEVAFATRELAEAERNKRLKESPDLEVFEVELIGG